jgi:hypothetical protein
MSKPSESAAEYAALTRDANALLDCADAAARRGDYGTEQRAEDAAGRLLDAASKPR